MKYTIFFILLQVIIVSCGEEPYEYNYSEDSTAGQIGMSAVAGIAHNNLNISFRGTNCFDTSTSVVCEAPMTRPTSIAGVKHLVIGYLDDTKGFHESHSNRLDEVVSFYRAPNAAYEVRFIMGFRELKIIITQKEWS